MTIATEQGEIMQRMVRGKKTLALYVEEIHQYLRLNYWKKYKKSPKPKQSTIYNKPI